MTKTNAAVLAAVVCALSALPTNAFQAKPILINGNKISAAAINVGGVNYAPLRDIAENLGGTVDVRDDGSINIYTPKTGPTRGRLRDLEDIWTASKLDDWTARWARWIEKTDLLLSLVDEHKLACPIAPAYAEALQRRLVSTKEYCSSVRQNIKIYRGAPRGLLNQEGMYGANESLASYLSELSDLGEDVELRGTPSIELRTQLTDHSTAGIELAHEFWRHRMAMLRWYENAAGYPIW